MYKFIVCLIVLAFSFWPAYAEVSSKIGIVDGDKLFDQYPGVEEAQKKIADAQDDLKNAIAESEKIFSEFEKQKKSETEKMTKKKELQAKIDTKAQDTKKMIESVSAKIEDEILASIKKVASEKGLEVVFDKRAVLTGGVDITESVSDVLKKKSIANETAPQEKVKLEKTSKSTD